MLQAEEISKKKGGTVLKVMLDDLPKTCDVGTKKDSKGKKVSWIGFKLHIDTIDGDIPITTFLSSASMHDSQAAIPLGIMSNEKVSTLYDLMDAAYDAEGIKRHSRSLGHVPLIDSNPQNKTEKADELKRQRILGFIPPEKKRYNERSAAERVNSRLKDDFGGEMVRVRGNAKVFCHLMFGILALTVDQLLNLVR